MTIRVVTRGSATRGNSADILHNVTKYYEDSYNSHKWLVVHGPDFIAKYSLSDVVAYEVTTPAPEKPHHGKG